MESLTPVFYLHSYKEWTNAWRQVNEKFFPDGSLHQVWWRGQSVSRWHLKPKIWRQQYPQSEKNMFLDFQRRAKVQDPSCPDITLDSDWLFLMQHHGLPTRLLDWTQSFLVASYFAIENVSHRNEDSALWALQPQFLNETQTGEASLRLPNDCFVIDSIKEVTQGGHPGGRAGQKIIAFLLPETHIRIRVQHAVATLHSMYTAINELPGRNDFLIKFVIKSTAKEEIALALSSFGIKKSHLFPTLDHLAEEIQEGHLYEKYK